MNKRDRSYPLKYILLSALVCSWAALTAQNPKREAPLPESLKKAIAVFPENPVMSLKPSGEEAALISTSTLGARGDKEGNEGKEGKGKTALRVSLNQAPKKTGGASLSVTTSGTFSKGEKILLMVMAKNGGTATETGEVDFDILVQRAKPKGLVWNRSTVTAGKTWKRSTFFFEASAAAEEGSIQITVLPGPNAMVIDLYEIQLYRFPEETSVDSLPVTRLTWAGRDENAPWRKEALARIEGMRRGDLEIQVLSGRGKAVPGVPIHLEMKRHAFPFGAAVDSDWTVGGKSEGPSAEKYQEVLATWFRRGVETGLAARAWRQADAVSQARRNAGWIQSKGLSNAGGIVFTTGRWDGLDAAVEARWHEVSRTNKARALEGLKRGVREAMKDSLARLKDGLGEWRLASDPGSEFVYTDLFPPEEICEWFKMAQAAAPRASRVLCASGMITGGGLSTNRLNPWMRMAQVLCGLEAPVDAIALPAHYGSVLPPPEKIYEMLTRFASLGKPLLITDLGIDVKDEAVQADYLQDVITVAFSHSAVASIDLAGFWEGAKPSGALWGKSGAPRPSGRNYTNLIGKQWWTTVEGKTDEQGFFRVRGYIGDYTLSMKRGDLIQTMRFSIVPGSTSITETVR